MNASRITVMSEKEIEGWTIQEKREELEHKRKAAAASSKRKVASSNRTEYWWNMHKKSVVQKKKSPTSMNNVGEESASTSMNVSVVKKVADGTVKLQRRNMVPM